MSEWPELKKFQTEFRAFVAEREWDQFHTPKNLAMALSGEIGELLEHFQERNLEFFGKPKTIHWGTSQIPDLEIGLTRL